MALETLEGFRTSVLRDSNCESPVVHDHGQAIKQCVNITHSGRENGRVGSPISDTPPPSSFVDGTVLGVEPRVELPVPKGDGEGVVVGFYFREDFFVGFGRVRASAV